MPRELDKTHVVLNIPDYNLRVYNNGAEVWQTRTVVGKAGHETPLLTETMKFITVNPTWNVPQSIIYNELLPTYETTDRQIFERRGLKMERDRDGSSIRVFQPPGERNTLGQIRFNFPTISRRTNAPTATAAGPDEIRRGAAVLRRAQGQLHRRQHQADAGRRRETDRLPEPDPGPRHLPDGVRGPVRQAAIPGRRLRPRRQS